MMEELSDELLLEIQEMASLFFSPETIAQVIGIEKDRFVEMLSQASHPVAQAFHKGAIMSEVELRRSVIKLAKQGSSPAQTLSMKLRDELLTDLINLRIK